MNRKFVGSLSGFSEIGNYRKIKYQPKCLIFRHNPLVQVYYVASNQGRYRFFTTVYFMEYWKMILNISPSFCYYGKKSFYPTFYHCWNYQPIHSHHTPENSANDIYFFDKAEYKMIIFKNNQRTKVIDKLENRNSRFWSRSQGY